MPGLAEASSCPAGHRYTLHSRPAPCLQSAGKVSPAIQPGSVRFLPHFQRPFHHSLSTRPSWSLLPCRAFLAQPWTACQIDRENNAAIVFSFCKTLPTEDVILRPFAPTRSTFLSFMAGPALFRVSTGEHLPNHDHRFRKFLLKQSQRKQPSPGGEGCQRLPTDKHRELPGQS